MSIKGTIKLVAAPLLYRSAPPFTLQPERLHLYLDAIVRCRDIPGAVVEVGCHVCGTAAIAARMMRRLDIAKRYICYDTFGGFVDAQFNADHARGTPRRQRHAFTANSMGSPAPF